MPLQWDDPPGYRETVDSFKDKPWVKPERKGKTKKETKRPTFPSLKHSQ